MLAALWGRPQATFTSELSIADGKASSLREVDAGLEKIEVDLPALITVMPDIMKAKRKPLDTIALADLGLSESPKLETVAYEPPPVRQAGSKVADVPALIAALKDKGVL